MNNYKAVIDLVEQRAGQKQWSTQIYINITGDPLRGMFLDRVVWWSDKSTRDDGYFWKTAKEWQSEIGFGYAQVARIAKELENAGFISLKKTNANGAPTLHYHANMAFIIEKVCEQIPILDTAEIQDCQQSNLDNLENRISSLSNFDFSNSQISITGKTTDQTTNQTDDLIPGEVCQALLDICKLNWRFLRRSKELSKSLLNTLGFLEEEKATVTEIIEFNTWRKIYHWTGKSPPTLKQVGELWPQYQDWVRVGRPEPEKPARSGTHKNGATHGHKSKQTGASHISDAPPDGIDPAIWERLNRKS